MNFSAIDKATNILAEAHAPGAAVEPAFLDLLLQALMDLFNNCFGAGGTSADMLRLARSNNAKDKRAARLLVERSVRTYLRRRHGLFGYARYNGDSMVNAILAAAKNPEVTEQDIQDLAQLSF